ncbi:MAG: hypothetical protein MUF75_04960 [Bacteroidia bacterium]|jgi:hypothetical protein|nr:hypothetical protein [Bacteroidia bacterium]
MKHTIKIVFGKEQVLKLHSSQPLTKEEKLLNVKEYTFNSLKEKDAFINGINEGLGWMEICIPELEIF